MTITQTTAFWDKARRTVLPVVLWQMFQTKVWSGNKLLMSGVFVTSLPLSTSLSSRQVSVNIDLETAFPDLALAQTWGCGY